MIERNQNPSPAQLLAWRRLWELLLTNRGQEKAAEGKSAAQRREVCRVGGEHAPR